MNKKGIILVKVIIIVLVVFAIGCFVAMGIMESWDTQKTTFENYETLVESGYLQNGWIPEYLPKDITNIVEVHNIDSNEVWIESDFTGKFPIDPKMWSVLATQDMKNRIVKRWRLQSESLDFYTHSSSDGVIAIDSQRGKLYFHSPGK